MVSVTFIMLHRMTESMAKPKTRHKSIEPKHHEPGERG